MAHVLGRRGLASVAAFGASHLVMTGRGLLSEGASTLSAGQETLYIILSVTLVIISGLAAGLTLGLLSIDRQV